VRAGVFDLAYTGRSLAIRVFLYENKKK